MFQGRSVPLKAYTYWLQSNARICFNWLQAACPFGRILNLTGSKHRLLYLFYKWWANLQIVVTANVIWATRKSNTLKFILKQKFYTRKPAVFIAKIETSRASPSTRLTALYQKLKIRKLSIHAVSEHDIKLIKKEPPCKGHAFTENVWVFVDICNGKQHYGCNFPRVLENFGGKWSQTAKKCALYTIIYQTLTFLSSLLMVQANPNLRLQDEKLRINGVYVVINACYPRNRKWNLLFVIQKL